MTTSNHEQRNPRRSGVFSGVIAAATLFVGLHAHAAPPAVALGKKLQAVAIDNAAHEAIVIGDKPATLYRLTLADNAVTTLALPEKTQTLALDERRRLALVAFGKKHVRFVDLAAGQLLPETIKLKHDVNAAAIHVGLGLAVLLEDRGDQIHLVDVTSRRLVTSLKLKGKLEGVAVHQADQKAYVVSDKGANLVVVDLKTQTLEPALALGKKAQHIVVDERLNLAIVAIKHKRRIEVIDLKTHQVVHRHDTLPGRPLALALNPDTHTVAILTAGKEGDEADDDAGDDGDSDDDAGGDDDDDDDQTTTALSLLDLSSNALTLNVETLPGRATSAAISVRYNRAAIVLHHNPELQFVDLPNAAPVLTQIVPPDVTLPVPALTLLAVGEHFVDASKVYVNGAPVPTRWKDPQHLEAELPAGSLKTAAAHAIKVVTPAPGGGESPPLAFTVKNPLPVLNAIAPTEVPSKKGDQSITLIGANFLPVTEAYFGAQKLATAYLDEAHLTAVIPGALLAQSGVVPITAFTPGPGGGLSAFVNLTARNAEPVIESFTPTSGPVGSEVTLQGENFDALSPGSNQVRFNGALATVVSASATQIKVIVPLAATSGAITVTNANGTGTSAAPFTVLATEDFTISVAPTNVKLPLGGNAAALVRLTSTGLKPYQQLIDLKVSGLPEGIEVSYAQARLSALQPVLITLKSGAAFASGTYPVTVEATGLSDGRTVSRTQSVVLEILTEGTTTLSGRVFHVDDRPFEGAIIRLGTESVVTNEAGQYRFLNPTARGDQVILIDGHTQNTPALEYPSSIVMPVMIVDGKDNLALTSYLQGIHTSQFTAITPGEAASVTTPEIPNFSLNIPEGATLTGWDGKPIDKINVRTVPVDRLPIRPLPEGVNARSVYLYYFFRPGGANPSTPIPVTMANDVGALPGEKVDLWYYDESPEADPSSNQWRIMGQGTVSEDGKSIVSDPGVGIPKFCCGASFPSPPPPPPPPGGDGCGEKGGNPVDLASGIGSVFDNHSLGINGLFPVRIACRYNSMSATIGPFGRGTFFNYNWQTRFGSQAITLITPNGIRYNLAREADGIYRASPGRAGAYGIEASVANNLTSVRMRDGSRYEFPTTGLQLLAAIVDPNSNRISLSRDGQGRIGTLTDARGRLYQFSYSGNLITQVRDPIGRTLTFTYDGASRLIEVTDPLGHKTKYAYDSNNRVVQKTDVRGAITKYGYDANGRTTEEILPDGSTYRFEYLTAGTTVAETRMTDPNGNVTTYRWNGQGYETKRIDALGRVFTKTRDFARNLLLAETDPLGRATRYTYDGRGNRNSVKDADGNITLIDYDPLFNKPTTITNALGHATTMAYDGKGNLTGLTNAEDETWTVGYTAHGKLKSITDPLGHTWLFRYDTDGNLTESEDPLGRITRQKYDSANRLIQVLNAQGQTTEVDHDGLDRITQITDALGQLSSASYDARSNLLTVTDPKGAAIETNAYDLRNRLTERKDAIDRITRYTYDGNNNLTHRTDPKGQQAQYTYDALNRLTTRTDADGRTTAYVYDLAGHLTQILDSQTGEIRYTYDHLDRVTSETSDQGVVSYAYDAIGRLTERRVNGQDATTYTYDKANRIQTITYRGQTVSYTYDKAGRLTSRTLPNGVAQTFAYNDASELLSITYHKPDGTQVEKITYTYDALGNRIERTRSAAASHQETAFEATYDQQNRLLTYNGYALSYDENGNLIEKNGPNGPTTYTWDATNKLTAISGPNGTASFTYDALGRRIEKTINGTTTAYLYDGPQAIAELKGSAVGTTYLTGLQIDEVLARYGNTNRTLLTDALGSVLAQTDDTGAITTRYAYSPFGETDAAGEASDNPVQYTSRENDYTGLYYYRARYYDPQLKRFITSDPIGLAGGLNTYAYVDNNPLRWIDPSGLSKFDKLFGLPKQFWNWYHKQVKRPGDPDLTKEEARELHDEWKDLGKPKPDNKGKQGGFADPELLEWLIPWPIIPSELGAHPCEMPGGPPCGPTEPSKPENCK